MIIFRKSMKSEENQRTEEQVEVILSWAKMNSELGIIHACYSDQGLRSLAFAKEKEALTKSSGKSKFHSQLEKELKSYMKGELKSFTTPLDLQGTEFQKRVWELLKDIPYGKTCSYQELSVSYGDPKAIRAVASANGSNPVMILVPCHRVIGSDGSLTGYAGGLWRKEFLLDMETGVKRLF
jgi:O-6-methylguanine DNA methyltransferase